MTIALVIALAAVVAVNAIVIASVLKKPEPHRFYTCAADCRRVLTQTQTRRMGIWWYGQIIGAWQMMRRRSASNTGKVN
jgi:hypothetical protein